MARFKKGDRVRVAFPAVTRDDGGNRRSTSDVRETGTSEVRETGTNAGYSHYLYLGTRTVRRSVLTYANAALFSERPRKGAQLDVEFTGTVDSNAVLFSLGNCTRVLDENTGRYHFLFLDSPSIRPVTEEKKEDKPMTYKAGDQVSVTFTAVTETSGSEPITTSRVREEDNGRTHYLYLGSEDARKDILANADSFAIKLGYYSDPGIGSTVQVSFTGTVDSTQASAPPGTVRVRSANFTHFLDPASLSLVTAKPEAAEVEALTALRAKLSEPVTEGTTVAIKSTDPEISSTGVINRIAALEAKAAAATAVSLTNKRTGDLLGQFSTKDKALEYLDEQDYIAERFDIRLLPKDLDKDDAAELAELRDLSLSGRAIFGTDRWNGGITLHDSSYFTAKWAREEASDRLDLAELDQWPLNLIDWDDAAAKLRAKEYLVLYFSGKAFFGKADG